MYATTRSKKKEKKSIAPNEASLGRWIGTLVAGVAIGYGLCLFLVPYVLNHLGENPDGTPALVGTSMGMSSSTRMIRGAKVRTSTKASMTAPST